MEMIYKQCTSVNSIYTFEMPPILEFIYRNIEGKKILNLFGGKVRLHKEGCLIHHNDLNPDFAYDSNFDALEVDKYLPHNEWDTIILDPPYTMFQTVKFYNGVQCQNITRVRQAVDKLLKSGGVVISFGYNSTGMGKIRGYRKEKILLVNLGASHNDYIITKERKMNKSVSDFFPTERIIRAKSQSIPTESTLETTSRALRGV